MTLPVPSIPPAVAFPAKVLPSTPFVYVLNGYCLENNQTVSRRYRKLEEALLHCLNRFNENVAIPNPYKSIRDYLSKNQ